MSFAGLLSTALAGGAAVIGKQAGDDIEQGRKADLMKQQADIEEQMRMRLAEFSEGVRQKGALADVTGPLGDAKQAYAARSERQKNDVAQENQEQERARIVKVGKGATGTDFISNLIANGDFAAATATGKAMTSGDRVVGYGGKLAGPDGKIIVDNEEDKARADAIRAGRAGAGSAKVDHFDAKQWDEARKPEKEWFKVADATGTDKYVPQLSAAFNRILTEAQNSGAMTPNQARSAAYDFTVGLQSRAESLMNSDEGKKAKMSVGQAADLVLKRMQEAAQPKNEAPAVKPDAAKPDAPAAKPAMLSVTEKLYERGGGPAREAADAATALRVERTRAEARSTEAKAGADPQIQELMRKVRESGGSDTASRDEVARLRLERYGLGD